MPLKVERLTKVISAKHSGLGETDDNHDLYVGHNLTNEPNTAGA